MIRSIRRKALREHYGKFPKMLFHRIYNTPTWRRYVKKGKSSG